MMDPKSVSVRADRMMRDHLALFEECFGDYERDGSQYRFEFNEDTTVAVYYEEYSKLLTKTYSTAVRITVRNVIMKSDWKAKLNMRGKLKVEKISLKALDRNSEEAVGLLNENDALTEKMFALFKNLDLQGITMEYRKSEQELKITIRLYPGAFIWVKIPPIYYDIRLKPDEIRKLCEITDMFSNSFTKTVI